ncbi:MAG: hypothetical protein ACPG7F_13295, partial [Aggregatilineales bacterium]
VVSDLEQTQLKVLELLEVSGSISDIGFDLRGDYLFASHNEFVSVWNAEDLIYIGSFVIDESTHIEKIIFDPVIDSIIHIITESNIQKWLWTGSEFQQIETTFDFFDPDETTGQISASAISNDGSLMIIVHNQHKVIVLNMITGELIFVPQLNSVQSDDKRIYQVDFSPDDFWLIFGTDYGFVFFMIE